MCNNNLLHYELAFLIQEALILQLLQHLITSPELNHFLPQVISLSPQPLVLLQVSLFILFQLPFFISHFLQFFSGALPLSGVFE